MRYHQAYINVSRRAECSGYPTASQLGCRRHRLAANGWVTARTRGLGRTLPPELQVWRDWQPVPTDRGCNCCPSSFPAVASMWLYRKQDGRPAWKVTGGTTVPVQWLNATLQSFACAAAHQRPDCMPNLESLPLNSAPERAVACCHVCWQWQQQQSCRTGGCQLERLEFSSPGWFNLQTIRAGLRLIRAP